MKYPQLAFTTLSLPWLFGPLLHLLTREFIVTDAKFESKHLIHFLPFVIYFGLNFPEFTTDSDGKLELLRNFIYTQNPQLSSIFYFFNGFLFIQILSYVAFTLVKIKNLQLSGRAFLASLSIGLLIYSFQKLIHTSSIYFTGYEFIQEVGTLLVLTCGVLLYVLTYISILKPSFLVHSNSEKYRNNKLSTDKIKEVKAEVEDYLLHKKKYQNKGLSLSTISLDINLPPHYISQVVNSEFGINVNDLINKFRVEEIKTKLVDPDFQHYRILAIALDAGFSNKASFYNAFKKQTGYTPTRYIKNYLSSQ